MSNVLCVQCGQEFDCVRFSVRARCGNCKKILKQEQNMRYRQKQKEQAVPLSSAIARKISVLTVVHDPLDHGGFAKGVTLNRQDWGQMLKHLSFTPGTILKDGQDRLYIFELGNISKKEKQDECI